MRLPIWSAYLLVPAFILAAAIPAIITSESRGVLAAICIGTGLVTALVFHGYCFLKGKVLKRLGKDEPP
jgi:hypothetical protein